MKKNFSNFLLLYFLFYFSILKNYFDWDFWALSKLAIFLDMSPSSVVADNDATYNVPKTHALLT